MVFASYNSASYLLPLDNDQSMSFYRNENRLFPTAIGPSTGGVAPPPGRNNSTTSANDMSITDMLTAAYHHEMQQQHPAVGGSGGGASGASINAGDCPFGRVQSPAAQQQHQSHQQQQLPVQQYHRFGGSVAMCDDFQPVGYFNGSSNGYYGFVPSLAATGGGGGEAGHSSNNNGLPGAAAAVVNNNHHPPATTANVNGHLSAIDFHGNQNHISCNDAGEQNNNNNNNEDERDDIVRLFHGDAYRVQQKVRKRKECIPSQQQEYEEMDTNIQLAAVGQQCPKRRKTDTDQNGALVFPMSTNGPFPGSNSGELPACPDRTGRRFEKGGHGWDLNLFHSLHGTGGGYR
uniref:Uncharacterized protein n=1 Tax=Anopheles culicifacies TaxID=139723 RepID=A0A182MKU5_9DIPT